VKLWPADERPGKAVGVQGVVPAVAPLDAEPAVVNRTVAPLGPEDAVVLYLIGHSTAHAAVRANALHGARPRARHEGQRHRLVGQRPGRARRGALAARDTGTPPHRLVQVEADAGGVAPAGPADHFIGLDLVTRPDATVAEDANRRGP